MPVEIIFLGTAGAVPTENRNLIATLLRRNRDLFLFDVGEDIQRQFVKAKISFNKPLKIFITHFHGDHINGLPGLLFRFSISERSEPLEIYGPKGILSFIKCLDEITGLHNTFPIKVYEFRGNTTLIDTQEYVIRSFIVEHNTEAYGYIFQEKPLPGRFYPERAKKLGIPMGPLWKKLQMGSSITLDDGRIITPDMVLGPPRKGLKIVISGDTKYSEQVIKAAQNADVLIHESMYLDDMMDEAALRGHSTAKDAARVAKAANVKLLILTHFSSRYTEVKKFEDEARSIFDSTIAAYDLLRIMLKNE
ncbi:MAG: ribonuclease Z [Candidatus Heimdallarchaeaceae archaeon]